jgi:hypothetical protein
MREFYNFKVESMTDDKFSMLENFLKSFHDFFHQVLRVLYTLQPPHTNNYLTKSLPPNHRLTQSELAKWRLDTDHGLLHGLITAYFAVKLAGEWTIPEIRENADLQRLIASCLVHDYAKVANGNEPHDQELREYFSLLLPETYSHSNPLDNVPLVQADRAELLRYEDKSWIDLDKVLENLPHETAHFEVWAFYKFIRPALAKIFRGRTEIWLRHGAEEADWRGGWPHESMVSRPKDLWPNFFYSWPNFSEYWAVEVGEITPSVNKPHLVDYFFPSGLMTIEEYRASEAKASIISAIGREHEIAYGKIPIHKWIFVFQDHQLIQDRYLVTNSGGFVTFPILTNIIDVADALYSKLYSIG